MAKYIEIIGSRQGVNQKQHSFPKLSQSHCAFQILEGWPWLQGNPIITWSAWNTGKVLWPLIMESDFRIVRVLHNFSKGKKRRKKVTLGSYFYTTTSLWVVFSLSTLFLKTVDWSLTKRTKQWERNVVLRGAGVCDQTIWGEFKLKIFWGTN